MRRAAPRQRRTAKPESVLAGQELAKRGKTHLTRDIHWFVRCDLNELRRGSLELGDIFSDISANSLEMTLLKCPGQVRLCRNLEL
jgi:hypothetical protein